MTNPHSGQIISGVHDETTGREVRFNIHWSAKIDNTVHFHGTIETPEGDIQMPTFRTTHQGHTDKFNALVHRCVKDTLRKHREQPE